jgi:tetratricopeptide (TPR) repeat protein
MALPFDRVGGWLTLMALSLAPSVFAHGHEHSDGEQEQLGTVEFATSCSPAAQAQQNRAVALLHSFEFGPAAAGFKQVAATDEACGIAYWGLALAAWGNPFAAGQKAPGQIQQGRQAIERANRSPAGSERERAYVAAVAELFRDVEHRDQLTRVLAYRDAMARLTAAHPEDMEASIFYALALAQSDPPTDKTYADMLKAGALLEQLFASHPDHPGLAHYIIHSYDVPALAPRALEAARRYAHIAPSAPHALHMPSHTFTRLGYWPESIEANLASAASARRDGATAEELHATDYLVYAYLQTGQDGAAKRLLDSLPEIANRFDPEAVGSAAPGMAGVFALAAIPARWALERGDWRAAAQLEPRASRFPHTEAMTRFARALGAARVGDRAAAQSSIDALQQLRNRLSAANESYWAGQVEIERQGAAAWLALAAGRAQDALAAMRAAAALEDQTEKNAVTPGPLAPARELLGEMLMETHAPAQALGEFEATLQKEPDRFRALAGAARAAAESGDLAKAAKHYGRLATICERGDSPGRAELAEARRLSSSTR